jgi:hypothetical protein
MAWTIYILLVLKLGKGRSKFSQIQPNRAKAAQRRSKKTAWFSLDLLGRLPIERIGRRRYYEADSARRIAAVWG